MGFFERIAAAVGIGRATLHVGILEPQQFRGSIGHGVLLLEGGEVEQEITKLTADLVEFWITGSGKNRTRHQRTHEQVTVAEDLQVTPGYRQEFPFQFTIPSDARCSHMREGWTLNAEAHIPWAVDARAQILLKVLPHPEVLAVQRAAKGALGLIPLSWDGSRAQVYYNFGAPEWLQPHLDGVAFRLEVVGDTLAGEMILNRQEQGLGDALRAMVGGDRESIAFQIPRPELVTKRGNPNPAGAYPHLQELFERAGVALPSPGPTGA